MDECSRRIAVTDLVYRYAHALDAGDVAGVLRCMAADALLLYDGGAIRIEGRDEARRHFTRTLTAPSTHLLSNILIDWQGNDALLRCSALACVTRIPGKVLVRGLVYRFHCRLTEDGYRIARLEHRVQWEFAVPAGEMAMGRAKLPGEETFDGV